MVVTASVGVAAAYAKSEVLAFFVSCLSTKRTQFGYMGMSIMLIFIALASGLIILRSRPHPLIACIDTWTAELNRNCSLKAGLSYQIDQIYTQGSQLLCTQACQCNADKTQWPQATGMVTSKLGSSSLLDCPMDFLNSYQRASIVPVMQALEQEFQCAGICQDPQYFLFSDVAK